jgi:hypothetical protein
VFRDKPYFLIATAWGNNIQLGIVQEDLSDEEFQENPRSKITYDGFYICESQVSSVFFISESILIAVVNNNTIRMLYTQNFSPGTYDDELFDPLDKSQTDLERSEKLYQARKEAFGTEDVRQLAEIIKGETLIDPMIQDKLKTRDFSVQDPS